MMEVYINQQTNSISENTPLRDLLDRQGLVSGKGIAVAVNDAVVSRDCWDSHILQPDDRIIIIRATQGG